MSLIGDTFNGIIRKRFWMDGAKLVVKSMQPSRAAILNDNAEIRRNPLALRKLDAMQWALQIPTDDYDKLLGCNPDLTHTDAETRNAAWKAFIKSPESLPYRVRHQSWR